MWIVLRTIILWVLWKERNDATFNNILWRPGKQLQCIWLRFVDYGKVEWERSNHLMKKHLNLAQEIQVKFKKRWCRNGVIVEIIDGNP